jgi:hypothetical protein
VPVVVALLPFDLEHFFDDRLDHMHFVASTKLTMLMDDRRSSSTTFTTYIM